MPSRKKPKDDSSKGKDRKKGAYEQIIEKIFFDHYRKGIQKFTFDREEIPNAANDLNVKLAKNAGDVPYTYRMRRPLPPRIAETANNGYEWSIALRGASTYEFVHDKITLIQPNNNLAYTKIPDSTPEIIGRYALSDEQALLAIVRYNRLIDLFLGLTAYSLQNHLRTQITLEGGKHQIETDEIYVGIDRNGCQYIIPVQAKGGTDKLTPLQTKQDMLCCLEKFPELVCRPVSAQFMSDAVIALFELTLQDGRIAILRERHYKFVPASDIAPKELEAYRRQSELPT